MLVTNYSIKFRTAVFVFAVLLLVVGGYSYWRLPREGSPDITFAFVSVSSIYEGSAPEEIENLITIPLEKQFNNLPNVKEITSVSAESVSSVTVEFTPDQDIDVALQKVRDRIDLARPDLPTDLDEPVVRDFNISTDEPVFSFAISGGSDLERLRYIAEELEEEIENVAGVLQANVYGLPEREIRVEVSPDRLDGLGLSFGEVIGSLARENVTMSAGNIEAGGQGKFQVRIPGEFVRVPEIEGIIVRSREGQAIYLRDVADVSDTYKDRDSISRVNGRPCMTITVQKRARTNSIKIIDKIQALLQEIKLPEDVEITVTLDQSRDIRMMLSELENNVFSGFLLVVLVLLLFLGFRNSLLVGLAIPFSMLISFVVLSMTGQTLNMMVLFSLVLSLGMLVDNAIVIVESIYRRHCEGAGKLEAARRGAAEVAWPVATSTITTLVAFAPMLFWPDLMGEFMSYIPRTLICTLTASLFVGLVINPALCSIFIRRKTKDGTDTRPKEQQHGRFVGGYMAFLRMALAHRGIVMAGCLIVLLLTVAATIWKGKGVELFPETDPRDCMIEVRYPEGTEIARVDRTLQKIEAELLGYDDIVYFQSTAGVLGGGFTGESGTHVGQVRVRFPDFEDRSVTSMQMLTRIRNELPSFAGAEVVVDRPREGPPTGAPISIEVSGEEFEMLSDLSRQIQSAIRSVPSLVDVRDDVEDAKPELQFIVDRERAARLGVDTRAVAILLRTALYGMEASRFRAGEDEYDITVRLPYDERDSAKVLESLHVMTATGARVPLSSVGRVQYAGGYGVIRRKALKRTITISGDVDVNERGIDEVMNDVKKRVSNLTVPGGCAVSFAGDNQEMKESGAFLLQAFVIAVGLILVVLVIQFNSAALPMVILMSVALSLVGVAWGLLLCRMKFGVIMTGVGVVSLAGIVVNNAIVLIDCIQQRRIEGMNATEAVVAAGRLRLRPVLLTATTTVLGLVPMAVGYSLEVHSFPWRIVMGSETSAWWAPMAVAVIFGLAVSTILTLVVVPVMYSLVDSAVRHFTAMGVIPEVEVHHGK